MEFEFTSHRDARELFETKEEYKYLWLEVEAALNSITDERLIEYFESHFSGNQKSLSYAINALIKDELTSFGWHPESAIFAESDFRSSRWRLDFAKDDVSIEVGFNHGEAVAWNLLKPAIAGNLNHVEKEIQTKLGIVITATDELVAAGGFDSAVGTYEKYVQYLRPLYNILTVPIVVIGLKAPKSFRIAHAKNGVRTVGSIQRL